jgi:hypothetical protein
MILHNEHLAALIVVGALSAACGSGAADGAGADGQQPGDACSPTGDVPCIAGLAEPCKDIHSGYDGDEFCRAAPDPSQGYQIHVGPTDYSDPSDVAKYLAAPGVETNWAEVVPTPNDATVFWDGYWSYMRPGSHHFILFGMPAGSAPPAQMGPTSMNGGGAESAVGAAGGEFLAGATVPVQDAMPHDPADMGSVSEMPPHANYAVNLHFINLQDHPLIQEIWVNFHVIPETDVQHWHKAITWYGGLGMNVPPSTSYQLTTGGATCAPPANAANMRVQGVTGHVHANTLEYSASMERDGATTLLFQDFDWHEPAEFRYNAHTDNGAPDPTTKSRGGYSGELQVQPTDRFSWECTGFNKSNVNLTFSNKVYDGEMCNVFGFYQTDTKEAGPWSCVFF